MSLLSKAEILAADDLEHREVEVPEWGGTVRLRTMTGAQLDAIHAQISRDRDRNGRDGAYGFNTLLVASALVDEAGQPLFTAKELAALAKKSATVLRRIGEMAAELNGLDQDDGEPAEGVLGNSEGAPTG